MPSPAKPAAPNQTDPSVVSALNAARESAIAGGGDPYGGHLKDYSSFSTYMAGAGGTPAYPSTPVPPSPLAPVPPASAAPTQTPAGTQPPKSSDTPAPAPGYTVGPKDTLESIATANGTNVQALMLANPTLTSPKDIKAGSKLTLPETKDLPAAGPLADVSKRVYAAVKAVPDQTNAGDVTKAGSAATASTASAADPITAAIAPIISQMGAAIQAIMAPGPTYTSLAQEYSSLVKSSGLEGLNLQMMNLKNVMDGSEDDIRAEVTASGGWASDSQVAALATARNNVILKKYNALSAQQAVAQDYVTNTMQYETADQQERDTQQNLALSKVTAATGILDKMATLQTTMLSTAQGQYDKVVTNVGYDGLASIVAGNPYQQALAEASLGLPSGTLGDPDKVAQLQTKTQKTQLLNAAKTYFAATGSWPDWYDPMTGNLKDTSGSGNGGGGSSDTSVDTSDPVSVATAAIVGNESGGDYSAVSPVLPSGAHAGEQSYGKYQVLESNIGPWTKEATGTAMTPQEFLASPQAQDAVAKQQISSLWTKYGNIDDVASVWFTGKPAAQSKGLKDQATGTTSEKYIADARAAFNRLSGSGSTSGGTAPPKETTQSITGDAMQQLLQEAAQRGVDIHTGEAGPHTFTINGKTYSSNGDNTWSYQDQAAAAPVAADGYTPKTLTPSQVKSTLGKNSLTYEDIRDVYGSTPAASIDPNNKTQVLNVSRLSMATNRALAQYVKSPIVETFSGDQQYFANIEAAAGGGSIRDVDLLDSYVKLAKGSGQVTDAQVNTILKGASIADNADVLRQKLTNGGVLSDSQRQQLLDLSKDVYKKYQGVYKPLYVQAVNNMHKQGIPPTMWGNLPDMNQLSAIGPTFEAAAAADTAPATQ